MSAAKNNRRRRVNDLLRRGLALQHAQRWNEAAAAYREALKLERKQADAVHYLGMIAYQRGDPDEALRLINRSLQIRRSDPVFHTNLGLVLQAQGRLSDAEAAYRRALAIDAGHTPARFNLGVLLEDCGRSGAAVEAYQGVLAREAGHLKARFNLGLVLKRLGRVDEACRAFHEVLEIDPHRADAWWNLATAKRFTGTPEDLAMLERLQSTLSASDSAAAPRHYLHYALAKMLDDLERYDEAWQEIERAHACAVGVEAYDAAYEERRTNAITEIFSRAFFEARRDYGHQSTRPIFIVGMPRSGTTLVEQILASHSAVTGAGELATLGEVLASGAARKPCSRPFPWTWSELSTEAVHQLAEAYLSGVPVQAGRFTDKMPGNFQHLGAIRLMFPHARVIHCVRHPLDVAVSTYFQCFTRPVSYAGALATIAHYYRQYRRIMRHWDAVLGDWYLSLCYEDLLSDQELWSRKLVAFCKLEWEDACLRFFDAQREIRTTNWSVRQPLYQRARGRWKHYRAHLDGIMDLAEETH